MAKARTSRVARVAVLGAGYWGQSHVRTFAAEQGAELTWVCDPAPAALTRAARIAPQARLTESVDDVLAASNVDAIVIATPAVTHAELALRAIASGRHVLIEKPLALSTEDAHRVADAAHRAGVTAMVGHLMIYHPAVEHLARLVHAGELGEIYYVSSCRANLGRLRTDENALWSFGPHDIAMAELLIGRAPTSVTARGESYLQPGIADVVFANLSYPSKTTAQAMAQIHLSWLSPRKERRLIVVGSTKMAEFDDCAAEPLRIFDRGYDRPPEFADYGEYLTIRNGDVFVPRVPMGEPLAAEARHFLSCIATGATPRTDLAAGVRVVEVLAAAQRSLDAGGLPMNVGTA